MRSRNYGAWSAVLLVYAASEQEATTGNVFASLPDGLDGSYDERLVLDDNVNLGGALRAELGSLSNLTVLDLSNLTVLRLENNQLSGERLPELGSLSNLTELLLYGNELSGCVPSSLEDESRKIIGPPFC